MRVSPNPSDEEAAAIAAAVTAVLEAERAAAHVAALSAAAQESDDTLHVWVEASRRSAQRAGLARGPWRLSGRLSRRARA
jgi:hypothetical protein